METTNSKSRSLSSFGAQKKSYDEAEKERETLMRALTELSKRAREKKVLTENQFVTLELVAVIERIVFHGLKNPDTFKGSKPHFWYWIERVSETETSLRPRKECLTLRTSRGRCRSWLRMMMNTNRLASALSVLLKSGNGLEVQLWYETWAALRFEISKKRIMTELEHISKFSFELNFVHAELLDTTEPGIVTQVSSRVITSSSNNEFSKMEEKRKKRPSSFRLGDLRVQNDDDEDDEDVPPLRRSVSRIQDEDIFHNISSSSSTTNTTTSTTKFTLSSKVVVVKGAGLESANGTYIESGTKDDAVRYVYNDLEFFRFRVPGNEDETITHFRWYLGNPERKIVYYYTDVTCKKQDEILHRTISSQTNGTWFAHSDAPKPAPSSVIDPSLLEEEDDNNDNELQPVRIKRKRRNKKRSPVLSPIKFPETPEHRPPGLSLHEEQESEFAISLRVAMLRLENRSDDGSHATTTTTTTATTVTPTTKASTKIQQQDEEETNVWERVSDEGGSNSSYYYNRRTGKSTWKRPPSMRQSPTTVPIIKMNSTTTKTSSSKTWHSFAEDRRRERAFLAYVEKRRELTDEINTLRKRLASKKSIFVQQKQEVVVEEDPLQSKEWALRLERGDGMSVQYLSVVSAKIFQEPSKHVRYVVRVDAVVEQEQTKRVRVQWNVHRRMAQFKALHAGLRYEILDAPQSLTPPLAPFDTDAHKERIRNRRKSNHNNVPELPVFPSSSWGRSFSDSYIEETKMKLNRYVRCLLGDSKLCEDGVGESVALRMFVREQRPGGYGAPRRRVGCWTGDDGRLHLGLVLERKTEGGHWLSPKERLALQSNKCAGCRRDIEISVFGTETCRFCDYSSFLFCTTCHQNDRAVIPARVLHQWDFTEGRVSKAAKEYLLRLAKQPALCVSAINPTLFTEKLPLHHARLLRVQLGHLQDFGKACTGAMQTLRRLLGSKVHLMNGTELYSLNDLVDLQSGELTRFLTHTIETMAQHITKECARCVGRGFVCELCQDCEPFYSFEILKAIQCRRCSTFFHRKCWRKQNINEHSCPKCARLKRRNGGQIPTRRPSKC